MSDRMVKRPMVVIGSALVITALLAIPFLTMAPTTTASQEPGGPVCDARDAVDEQFVSAVFTVPIIVEARDGNLLSRQELIELLDNTAALRNDPDLGSTLLSFFDERTGTDVAGVRTIADIVDDALPGGLRAATDEQVATTADAVIDRLGARSDVLGLSVETTFDQASGHWVAPALVTQVVADNEVLGFANTGVTLGTDTAPEEYARDIVAVVQGDETTLQGWGIYRRQPDLPRARPGSGSLYRIHHPGRADHRWHCVSLVLVDRRDGCGPGSVDRVALRHQ